MFERRLKTLLLCLAVVLAIVCLRLFDLQVVRADAFKRQAERALLRPASFLPFVRGRVFDRTGRLLAADEPRWQVSVDFDVLAGDLSARAGETPDRNASMWRALADFGGEGVESLRQRGRGIVKRIEHIREIVSRHHGYEVKVREETMAHPILTGLDDQQQIAARERFASFPWVSIEHGTHRVYAAHPSMPHVLGRLGPVDADDLRDDPRGDDPLACYHPTDRKGVSGVEHLAEDELRGRRGRLRNNRRGEVVEYIPPVDGRDATLTLRLDLQKALYELLAESLPDQAPLSPGGSIVVLHVPTREVLALVSYPGYDANDFSRRYDELRADTRRTPLRFRAVANVYEPGSTIKPLTCLAALGTGAITTDTTFHCLGRRFEDQPDRLRCWQVSGTSSRMAHGDVNVEGAITGSCNVFMYHLGELLGVGGLTEYLDIAGLGRTTGIALPEEVRGTNPTPSWLATYRGEPASVGRARNYAIGQGELNATPLQVANLMALYASGEFRQVSLIKGDREHPAWRLPNRPEHWAAIREGIYRVTNDPQGTAYRTSRWTNGRFALCGKTGSATTFPKPTHYRVAYIDPAGQRRYEIVPAGSKGQAAEDFRRRFPTAAFDPWEDVTVESVWPPLKPGDTDENYAHAWFAGYLQRITVDGQPVWTETPPVAFAVLVEFGGSGGHTAGPIARQVAQQICDILGDGLDPDTPPVEGGLP